MINEVYTVVQEILNKNGYGLLTPARFVSFAEAAQLKVLDESIDEYRRAKRTAARYDAPDTLGLLEAVIEIFSDTALLSRDDGTTVQNYHTLPSDYMRWGNASVDNVEIVKVPARQKASLERGMFVNPNTTTPFCYIEGQKLYVLPLSIGAIYDGTTPIALDEVQLQYYRYPAKPNWTYTMVGNQPIFNPGSELYQDFELPYSMMNKLIVEIAAFAGVHIRDEFVMQYASGKEKMDFDKRNN